MREARLVGLSQDGKQLILAMAETGEEFAVPVDDRLRAALRGDRARLGQLEIQMESALRPRDIQARIRAGESPEAVAAVAQMPMERVMAFAGPVLAERDHIASLAQRASVRRRGGGDAPTRNLGAWVTDRLRTRQVDPTSAEWDAWRRDDGRWAVRVSYYVEAEDEAEQKEEKVAMFAYDAPGRYAVPDDDEARWLVGEQAQVIPPPVQPTHQPGERRLAAVADIDLTIAPDHGADSYEAGFEDTISLRRRNQPPTPEVGRESARDDGRDRDSGRGWDSGRDDGRDRDSGSAREGARGWDSGREGGRESGRREVARDAERGPRRVHSVPDPDEEPTLIDVPVDQPPALRPAVRAVERSTQPPAEFVPPEERDPFTERRTAPERGPSRVRQAPESRAAETPAPDPRATESRDPESLSPESLSPESRGTESLSPDSRGTESRGAESRGAETRAAGARAAESRAPETRAPERQPAEPAVRTEPQPTREAPAQEPTAEPAASASEQLPASTEPAAAQEEAPAEPKKKPARRGKRASVPSWDEIMFGKKAD